MSRSYENLGQKRHFLKIFAYVSIFLKGTLRAQFLFQKIVIRKVHLVTKYGGHSYCSYFLRSKTKFSNFKANHRDLPKKWHLLCHISETAIVMVMKLGQWQYNTIFLPLNVKNIDSDASYCYFGMFYCSIIFLLFSNNRNQWKTMETM